MQTKHLTRCGHVDGVSHKTGERSEVRRDPIWLRAGAFFRAPVLGAVAALVWLILRTGTRPTRITYPCQQAALGSAAALFAVPILPAIARRFGRLARAQRPHPRVGATIVVVPVIVAVVAIGSTYLQPRVAILDPPPDYHPEVFLVENVRGIQPGRFGGVDDLVTLMGLRGLKLYRSDTGTLVAGPDGLIEADDVVLLKVNAQWPKRGGTNTDVIRGVMRVIVEHPDGFVGEIIVADNGQSVGSLNRTENNAEDISQSVQDVVNDFVGEGWQASTSLWDPLGPYLVEEYSEGDMTSGYVVNSAQDPDTGIKTSYPKFQSDFGTYVSYKNGIWSSQTQTYDLDKLVVINMPVFKTHFIYGITAAVKNHMGVITSRWGTDSHRSVGRGGMGTVLAEVRMPDLTIMDCIWILARPGLGPGAPYDLADRVDRLVSGTDPLAIDVWATKHIMIPRIIENGYSYSAYHDTQDPDNPDSVFQRYLSLSMNELLSAGIETTNDYTAVRLYRWIGDLDRDGDTDLYDYLDFVSCVTDSGGTIGRGCEDADFNTDERVDLVDYGALQTSFTGEL